MRAKSASDRGRNIDGRKMFRAILKSFSCHQCSCPFGGSVLLHELQHAEFPGRVKAARQRRAPRQKRLVGLVASEKIQPPSGASPWLAGRKRPMLVARFEPAPFLGKKN